MNGDKADRIVTKADHCNQVLVADLAKVKLSIKTAHSSQAVLRKTFDEMEEIG